MKPSRSVGFLTLGGLLFTLQQTVVVPALPVFQRELHTTTAWATWLLTGPLLTAAVAGPLLGRLGDQYGRRRMLAVTFALFGVSSIACACAWDIASLIVFRTLQGAGGAIFPLTFALLRETLPRDRLRPGIAFVSIAYGVGGVLGIVVAGPIIDAVGWRGLFVFGAGGLGAAAMLGWRRPGRPGIARPSLDLAGATILSTALVCFLLALTEGARWGWTSAPVVVLLAVAVGLAPLWVRVELRAPDPMVDIRMLASRQFAFANMTTVHFGFVMFTGQILVPNFVMASGFGFGASPTEAGLYMLPTSAAMLASTPFAGRLARRARPAHIVAGGLALSGVGSTVFALAHDEPWQLIASMALRGLGTGAVFATLPVLVLDAVAPERTAVATGLNNVARTVGSLIGAQTCATLLATITIGRTGHPAESGFVIAMWVSTAVSLAGAGVALLGSRRRAPAATRELNPRAAALPLRRSG